MDDMPLKKLDDAILPINFDGLTEVSTKDILYKVEDPFMVYIKNTLVDNLENYKYTYLNLDRAIDMCTLNVITDEDGYGEWYLYDKKSNKDYFGICKFNCNMLDAASDDIFNFDLRSFSISDEKYIDAKSKIINNYKSYFNNKGLELKGIIWRDKALN